MSGRVVSYVGSERARWDQAWCCRNGGSQAVQRLGWRLAARCYCCWLVLVMMRDSPGRSRKQRGDCRRRKESLKSTADTHKGRRVVGARSLAGCSEMNLPKFGRQGDTSGPPKAASPLDCYRTHNMHFFSRPLRCCVVNPVLNYCTALNFASCLGHYSAA